MSQNAAPLDRYLEIEIEGQARKYPVGEGHVCRIGRAERNTIVLSSIQVSRDHALVDCPDGRDCIFTDLGSVNGAYINGVRVAGQQALKDGDLISVAEFRFVFRQSVQEGAEASDEMVKTIVHIVNQEITVMVIDIRGYTPLSQKIGEDKLGEVVGHFFRECGSFLRAQGAWSQKYIGDAVMAIWMHDAAQSGSQAVHKALQSVHSIYGIANSLAARFQLDEPVRIGAGINTGFASLGNLGSTAGADHTALGDAVNKAFRLESATKDAGVDVLIGQSTLVHLGKQAASMPFEMRHVFLKGYSSPEICHGLSFTTLEAFLGSNENTRP